MMKRPNKDEFYIEMAELVSKLSTCLSRQVGAVLVKDGQIISTGYNGAPKGLPHCDEVGCIRKEKDIEKGTHHELCRGVHAEQNTVIQGATHGTNVQGATLYCTTSPCVQCTKILINACIDKVVYKNSYPDELAKKILEQSDIELVRL